MGGSAAPRVSGRIVTLLVRAFVLFLVLGGTRLATTLSLLVGNDAETVECCTDCPLDASGRECPPQCPICQCSHGAPAALPQATQELPLDTLTASASSRPIPYEARLAKAPLLSGLYRPPRPASSFA